MESLLFKNYWTISQVGGCYILRFYNRDKTESSDFCLFTESLEDCLQTVFSQDITSLYPVIILNGGQMQLKAANSAVSSIPVLTDSLNEDQLNLFPDSETPKTAARESGSVADAARAAVVGVSHLG